MDLCDLKGILVNKVDSRLEVYSGTLFQKKISFYWTSLLYLTLIIILTFSRYCIFLMLQFWDNHALRVQQHHSLQTMCSLHIFAPYFCGSWNISTFSLLYIYGDLWSKMFNVTVVFGGHNHAHIEYCIECIYVVCGLITNQLFFHFLFLV